MLVLNKKPHRIVIPQACNHVTSFTDGTASIKQPFHSMYTGQLSKKLKSKSPTIAITTAPTKTANFSMSRSVVFQALHSKACFTLFICFILGIHRVQVQVTIPYFKHINLQTSRLKTPRTKPSLGALNTTTLGHLSKPCYAPAGFITVVSARRFQFNTDILRKSAILRAIRRLISRKRF